MRNRKRLPYFSSKDNIDLHSLQTDLNLFQIPQTDRVYQTSKFEQSILQELFDDYMPLEDVQPSTHPTSDDSFFRDVFHCIYSSNSSAGITPPRKARSAFLYRNMIGKMLNNPYYRSLQDFCCGKEIPAYEASLVFHQLASSEIPALMDKIQQGEDWFNKYDRLMEQCKDISDFLFTEVFVNKKPVTKKILRLINILYAKKEQCYAIGEKIESRLKAVHFDVSLTVTAAMAKASERAEEIYYVLLAWGDDSPNMQNTETNKMRMERISHNAELREIARLLGRFREIIADKRKNGHAYGRGAMYDITFGNDIGECLTEEFADLANKNTQPIFLQKLYNGDLSQYRQREKITKGKGDIIVCVDESISTRDIKCWAKALALALLDIAAYDRLKFAYIHFAGENDIRVDSFLPGKYSQDDVMEAAEHFFDGYTNFERPLSEAMKLINGEFDNADICFITDGQCSISEQFAKQFLQSKLEQNCFITGILVDSDGYNTGDSLIPFCDKVFRTSELSKENIAIDVISRKTA